LARHGRAELQPLFSPYSVSKTEEKKQKKKILKIRKNKRNIFVLNEIRAYLVHFFQHLPT
jgi:hypothetical protein